MRDHGIIFAGLMPHAPILVPGVGGDECMPASDTMAAMTELARRIMAVQPETIVVVSPHAPRRGRAFGIWTTPRLRGSFARFGTDTYAIDLPLDSEFIERLVENAQRFRLRTWEIAGRLIDHGSAVPLSYLTEAGWQGPTVVAGLNEPGDDGLDEFGRAIAESAGALERRVVIVASGDMSHRLTESAPLGYDPAGQRFDQLFIDLLEYGAPKAILRIDPTLLDRAGEDVVESTRVAVSACDFDLEGRRVLSYDGPFGVGYGVAVLCDRSVTAADLRIPVEISDFADLPKVARAALKAAFEGGPASPPFQAAGKLAERCGIFVTVRTEQGELRGCQGCPRPTDDDLVTLAWHLAGRAAFHDPRFAPVSRTELPDLRLTVTVLGDLQDVKSTAELDPEQFGVLVRSAGGRSGLLLPGIKEIGSVAEQLLIARDKAGIEPDEPVDIQRFRTRVFEEH